MDPTTNPTPPVCLMIAGSDPSGGAGLQADLKTFAARGVYGMSALTVATDCETLDGVQEVQPMPPAFVRRQIDRICTDIPPQAVKTGMLFSEAIICVVAEAVRDLPHLVVDPVMTTRRGERLLSDGAEGALTRELLPWATLVTPSLPEAERLTGQRVVSRSDMEEAAAEILALGPGAVCVTGGHLKEGGPPTASSTETTSSGWRLSACLGRCTAPATRFLRPSLPTWRKAWSCRRRCGRRRRT